MAVVTFTWAGNFQFAHVEAHSVERVLQLFVLWFSSSAVCPETCGPGWCENPQ